MKDFVPSIDRPVLFMCNESYKDPIIHQRLYVDDRCPVDWLVRKTKRSNFPKFLQDCFGVQFDHLRYFLHSPFKLVPPCAGEDVPGSTIATPSIDHRYDDNLLDEWLIP